MMDRKGFIQSLAAVAALQAIPGGLISQDTNDILPEISYQDCLQALPDVRLHDVLITPEGEAFNVIGITDGLVFALVINSDPRDHDNYMILPHDKAQAMICHDWDDLNS
jgi:hypothetical protein